ncbi:hypothetical protein J5N97_026009 [Dioscorea zingiberensis]|uniref:Uncharacterized protein n=1 Tax=Dioscorea zingiberensis TaxID=325984 RepID=A0A9D5C1L0_9LILI|nr:hypothetical protein J5N97_026009 [Dioscorea zingiberensis]
MVCCILLVFFAICISRFNLVSADDLTIYFTGNISTSFWINNNQSLSTLQFSGGSIARFILLNESLGNPNGHKLGYGCGFFCRLATQASCEFGIILVDTTSSSVSIRKQPQVVWSANRDSPVGENATLEFSKGSLVLRDSGGEGIWSSNCSSQSIVGMSIASGPNLVLFNSSKGVVWQSFDHPTDTLLPGQMLRRGQTLSSTTLTNSNMSTGPFFISISQGVLTAFIHTDVLVPYLLLGRALSQSSTYGDSLQYVRFEAGNVSLAFLGPDDKIYTNQLAETQRHHSSDFLRLDPDGGWRIYSWMLQGGWRVVYDFMYNGDQCQLPLRCGRYGVCKKGQCSCPKALDGVDYFAPLDTQSPELGCNQIGLSTSQDKYQLVGFGNLSYFSYADPQAALSGIRTLHECKEACSRNASCQAAFFTYHRDASVGRCYLSSEVLSIRADKVTASVSSAYLKVKASESILPMACSTVLAFFFLVSIFHVSLAEISDDITIFFSGNGSTSWKNHDDSIPSVQFIDGTVARFILVYGPGLSKIHSILGHGCGFICSPSWEGLCQFAVVLVETPQSIAVSKSTPPQVIWSANRHSLVGENATLEFSNGSLILKNSEGVSVWSSNTSSLNVVGMSLAADPNLVLIDQRKISVWQTFKNPTDTLFSKQFLRKGQSLTSSPNFVNSITGLFSLSISHNVLTAYVHSEEPIPFLVLGDFSNQSTPHDSLSFVTLQNGKVVLGFQIGKEVYAAELDETQWLPNSLFMRLDSDGSLRIYNWEWEKGWMVVYDFMEIRDLCQLPLRCGKYGVCRSGQCSCPKAQNGDTYFFPLDDQSPQLGCYQIGAFSDNFKLVDFGSLGYFTYSDPESAVHGIQKLDDCKKACMGNYSCKAVFFMYDSSHELNGLCYLPSIVLSIQAEPIDYRKGTTFSGAPAPAPAISSSTSAWAMTSKSYLKVRDYPKPSLSPSSPAPTLPDLPSTARKSKQIKKMFILLAAVVPAVLAFAIIFSLLWRRITESSDDDFIEQVPGMPLRFSYKELCVATAEKNLDYDQNDSHIRLLSLLRRKADENQLTSIVHRTEEMQCEEEDEEALRLIRLGLWCLNDDYKKRPSMSTVVKALQGAVELDNQMIFTISQTMVPSINSEPLSSPNS